MAARRRDPVEDVELPPPARTIAGRNDQLTEAAFKLAHKRLLAGNASAQEVVHFLKQGSVREELEREKIRQENIVLQARVKEMESRVSSENLSREALDAFRGYVPSVDDDEIEGGNDPYLYNIDGL